MYVPPSGVSWLGLWAGATPRPTKRASVPAVLLKAVGALPDTDGEVMSPESRRSFGHRSNGLRLFTHDIFEMIAMIVEVRTACWLSDQAAARKLETPTARHWYGHRSLRSSKRGGRGSFTMLPRHYEPTGAPSHALWANGTLQPAYRRRSQKVGQPGRAGLVGIF